MFISGKNSVNIFLKSIEDFIENEVIDNYESELEKKVKKTYYETMLLKTFIVYVRKNTIYNTYLDADIQEIKHNIVYVDDIESLVLLNNLNGFYKNKYKIKWIATEFYEENISSNDSNYEILNYLKIANILEFWQEPKSRKLGSTYRIDFQKMENNFFNKLKYNLSDIRKNNAKFFFFNIFNIQLHKDNSIPIVEQILQKIDYKKINITKREHKNVYNYRCQICNKKHEIILSKSKRDTKKDVKKYTRIDEDFIHLNKKNRFEILCNHSDTEHENFNLNFSFDRENLKLNEGEYVNLDKVFLYQFYNFVRSNNEAKIEYYKDDIVSSISVDEFINKFVEN